MAPYIRPVYTAPACIFYSAQEGAADANQSPSCFGRNGRHRRRSRRRKPPGPRVKAHIHEKVEVGQFVSDATGIAAELPTEFRVYKDWENGFFQRPLKAGEVMRTISFGLYEVKDRKFTHIRAVRYKQIHDWRMEK